MLEQSQPELFIVLITAANGERIDRFRAHHDIGYLRKPINFPYLVSMLCEQQPHPHDRAH